MTTEFINSPLDMKWLRDVHLSRVVDGEPLPQYESAVIVGNEDAPDEIRCYMSSDPLYLDPYDVIKPNDDGTFRRALSGVTP